MNRTLKRGLMCLLAASALPLASACSKIDEENTEPVTAEQDVDRTLAVTLSDASRVTP